MILSDLTKVKRSFFQLVVLASFLGLAACGGGGGGGTTPTPTPTPLPDATPNQFSLSIPSVNIQAGTEVTTEAITVQGMDTAATITIVGGEYAINGGDYTAAAGSIRNGQSFTVRAMASPDFDGEVAVTVIIGGVSDSITVTTEAQDIAPDAFSFTAETGALRNSEVTSSPQPIAGINDTAPIAITGGEYAIDSGDFTAAAGVITSGQTVTVRVTSAAEFSTAITADVTIGGVVGSFTATTEAQDIVPDALIFADVTVQTLNESAESEAIPVAGMNDIAPISVSGGEYAIDDGEYTAESGVVAVGQLVKVRGVGPAQASGQKDITLSIGGGSGIFSIFSVADTEAPVAEIYFPTQVSLTDAATLRVRGVATDNMSSITSVTVNGETAESSDSFANWQVTVPLSAGDNELTVIATDAAGNISEAAVLATSTQRADLTGSFPMATSDMDRFGSLQFIENDQKLIVAEQWRNYYYVDMQTGELTMFSPATDPVNHDRDINVRTSGLAYFPSTTSPRLFSCGPAGIQSIDFTSGARTVISDISSPDATLAFDWLIALSIFRGETLSESYLLTTNESSPELVKVDIATGEKSIVTDLSNPDLGTAWTGLISIAVSEAPNRAFVATGEGLFAVDLQTGIRSLIATNDIPNAGVKFPSRQLHVTADSNFLYGFNVLPSTDGKVKVDLRDDTYGQKTLITGERMPGLPYGNGMALLESKSLAYTSDRHGVGVVDLLTGEQVVLVKGED